MMVVKTISGIESETLDRFNKDKDHYEQQQGLSVNADKFVRFLLDVYETGVKVGDAYQQQAQSVENSSTNGGAQ